MAVQNLFIGDANNCLMISELLSGIDLFTAIRSGLIKSVPDRIYILKQVLRALGTLHIAGLIHRDVKLENIVFRRLINQSQRSSSHTRMHSQSTSATLQATSHYENPSVSVPHNASFDRASSHTMVETSPGSTSNFLSVSNSNSTTTSTTALSRRLLECALVDFDTLTPDNPTSNPTSNEKVNDRRLVGTLAYLSPEVLQDGNYSVKSDLWAVGVVMYCLFAGLAPFDLRKMKNVRTALDEIHRSLLQMRPASTASADSIKTGGGSAYSVTVLECGFNFNVGVFKECPFAVDLCKRFLEYDPHKRLTSAVHALRHPLFAAPASSPILVSPQETGQVLPAIRLSTFISSVAGDSETAPDQRIPLSPSCPQQIASSSPINIVLPVSTTDNINILNASCSFFNNSQDNSSSYVSSQSTYPNQSLTSNNDSNTQGTNKSHHHHRYSNNNQSAITSSTTATITSALPPNDHLFTHWHNASPSRFSPSHPLLTLPPPASSSSNLSPKIKMIQATPTLFGGSLADNSHNLKMGGASWLYPG